VLSEEKREALLKNANLIQQIIQENINRLNDLISPLSLEYCIKPDGDTVVLDGIFLNCCHQNQYPKLISQADYDQLYKNKKGQACIRCQKAVETIEPGIKENFNRVNVIEQNIQQLIFDFKQAYRIYAQVLQLDEEDKNGFEGFKKAIKQLSEEFLEHLYNVDDEITTLLTLKSKTFDMNKFFFLEEEFINALIELSDNPFKLIKYILINAQKLNVFAKLKLYFSRHFLEAVANNNQERINFFLRFDLNFSIQDGNGHNALFWAFHYQNKPLITQLIERGVVVESSLHKLDEQNVWDAELTTLYVRAVTSSVLYAIEQHNIVEVMQLIEMGLLTYASEEALLFCLAKKGNGILVSELLSRLSFNDVNVCDVNVNTPLYYAVERNNYSIVNSLLFHRAKISVDMMIMIDKGGYEPEIVVLLCEQYLEAVFVEIQADNVEELKKLWFYRSSEILRARDFFPLHIAINCNSKKVIAYLINELGYDVNERDHRQHSCIYYATHSKNNNVLRILLQHDAAIDHYSLKYDSDYIEKNISHEIMRFAKEEEGAFTEQQIQKYLLLFPTIKLENKHPLVWALEQKKIPFLLFLLKKELQSVNPLSEDDILQKDLSDLINQLELLKFAIDENNSFAIQFLIKQGATITLEHVRSVRSVEAYQILLKELKSVFFERVRSGDVESVRMQIESGIMVYEKELESDETAISIALSNGDLDMVNYLLQSGAVMTNSLIQKASPDFLGELCDQLKRQIKVQIDNNYCDEALLRSQLPIACVISSDLLCYAAEVGKIAAAETLIHVLQMSVNILDNNGQAPVVCALKNEHIAMVEFLFRSGAYITEELVRLTKKLSQVFERYHVKLLIQEQLRKQFIDACREGNIHRLKEFFIIGVPEDLEGDFIAQLIQFHANNIEKFLELFSIMRDDKNQKSFYVIVQYHFNELLRAAKCFSLFHSNLTIAEQRYIQMKLEIHQESLRFIMRALFAECFLYENNLRYANKCFAYLKKHDESWLVQYLNEIFEDNKRRKHTVLIYSKEILFKFFNLDVCKPFLFDSVINSTRNPHVKFDYLELLIENHCYYDAFRLLHHLYEKYPLGMRALIESCDYVMQEANASHTAHSYSLFQRSGKGHSIAIGFFAALLNEDAPMMERLVKTNPKAFDRLLADSINSVRPLDVEKHHFTQTLLGHFPNSMAKKCKIASRTRLKLAKN